MKVPHRSGDFFSGEGFELLHDTLDVSLGDRGKNVTVHVSGDLEMAPAGAGVQHLGGLIAAEI